MTFIDDQTNPRRIAILQAMQASRTALGPVSVAFEQALEAAGWCIAPLEPSVSMVEAGRAALSQGDAKVQTHSRVMWVWADMLAHRNT